MNWLACTAAQVVAINAALPSCTRVAAKADIDGALWLGADLKTDCGPGQTYAAAQALIMALLPGTPAAFPADALL
jgi:hypothetical protein